MTSISVAELFERLASQTWNRIEAATEIEFPLGEEGITEWNLLEIMIARLKNVKVVKVSKEREAREGIDWEWWIGSHSKGYWRYAIQAKKLCNSGRYDELRHTVNGNYQIDLLERYAKANQCIPFYCFYNHVDINNISEYWHCNYPLDQEQFGCTVVPIDVIRAAFPPRRPKTFKAIHIHNRVLPWRCLVKCPAILSLPLGAPHPLASGVYRGFSAYRNLPFNLRDTPRDVEGFEFSPDYYNTNINIYPSRIIFIEIDAQ